MTYIFMVPQRLVLVLELLLLLLSVLVSISSCNSISQISSSSCGDLPPPFAYSGAADGFNVLCNMSKLFLQLNTTDTYELNSINIVGGYVSIVIGSLFKICDKSESAPWHIDLRGTPYTLSTRSKLTVLGCNALVVISGNKTSLDSVTSGCLTFCVSSGSVTNGSCTGIGCCRPDIPRGMKNLNFNFRTIDTADVSSYEECNEVFFVDQDDFQSEDYVIRTGNATNDTIALEWTIGNKTCEQASIDLNYACKSRESDCYELPDLVGYRCNCSAGFMGNPYHQNGCLDIDECADPSFNRCANKSCINTFGSYVCACPRGLKGDGRMDGTGCTSDISLTGTIFGLSLGFGTLLVALVIFYLWRKLKKRKQKNLRKKNFEKNHGLLLQQLLSSQESSTDRTKIFTQMELEKATNNFDSTRILGRGGHGTVYKGILSDQRVVAIKRSKIVKNSEINQFINEVAILSHVSHRNVVMLYGCCLDTEVPLLVFEFISNGTLYDHLHNHQSWLPWNDRLRIAAEVTTALSYLHSAASISIFHRDIKSSNILLDDYYTAKVSDFGASRSIPPDETHVVTAVQGTFGYLDPEYYQTGQLTEKSDVYSFGIILLELLTGKMPVSMEQEQHISLSMQFLRAMQENSLFDFVDARIRIESTEHELDEVFRLANMCLKLKGSERPTMKEVEHKLQGLKKFKQHARKHITKDCPENTSFLGDYTNQGTRNYSTEMEMILSLNDGR